MVNCGVRSLALRVKGAGEDTIECHAALGQQFGHARLNGDERRPIKDPTANTPWLVTWTTAMSRRRAALIRLGIPGNSFTFARSER
jgi:hypothetical protein